MNVLKKGYLCSMLLVMLALGAVLGACGTDSPTGQAVQTANGVNTAGTATAGLKTCTGCHATETSEWMLSMHGNVTPAGNLYSQGYPTIGQIYINGVFPTPVTTPAVCQTCHDPQGDSQQLVANYTGNTARPVVGCEACHSGGALHVAQGGAGPIGLATTTAMVIGTTSTLQASAQLRTCTACHELLDPNDPVNTPATATHSASSPVTPKGNAYIITDSHFATPGSFTGAGNANVNDITGYAMNYSSEKVCSNCHNPHSNADINRDWAKSKHADTKAADAWAHYNWSCDATCFGASGNRTVCQRCHTTTGFSAYADALQSGNSKLATAIWNGSAPPLKPQQPGFKPEMLECSGCHADNRGGLRNPSAYNATYPIGAAPNASVSYQYPDVSASNVCMPCHTGRVSGKTIQALNTGQSATVNFSNYAYQNVDGHYLTAGGTMFKGTAYEYAGRSYVNPKTYMHDQIGTTAQPGTGINGPCIGCHMDRTGMPGNHLFEPVSTVAGATVVTSDVCFKCHAGSSIDFGTVVQDEADNFNSGLTALQQELIVSGYTFTTGFPYFANTNWLIFGDTDVSGNSGGKNTMGAAFNFSLLYHEPGAYVHNSRYVKRILYDSIDWIDDGQMNYSVGNTLNAACGGVPPAWCQGAKSYLLYGPPNTSGERP